MNWLDLAGEIPEAELIKALDDNRDGEADEGVWAMVLTSAEARLEDCFGGKPPAKFSQTYGYAKRVFVLETLFTRRGFTGEANPYTRKATDAERRLRALADGEERIDGGVIETGLVVSEELSGTPKSGFLA